MIRQDQPTCFPPELLVSVSSSSDGTMLDRTLSEIHHPQVVAHRQAFCQASGAAYTDVVYQRVVYGAGRSYDQLCEVDSAATTRHTAEMVADGLVTRSPGVGLLLPVADCVATVLYDPVQRVLALLHLGRHSTLSPLLVRTIDRLVHEGSRAEDIIVWMSPSAQRQSYVMQYFDQMADPAWQLFCSHEADGIHLDLQGFNAAACQRAGIAPRNIHISPVDTVTSPDYFSHTAGDTGGRFAVLAMMRED